MKWQVILPILFLISFGSYSQEYINAKITIKSIGYKGATNSGRRTLNVSLKVGEATRITIYEKGDDKISIYIFLDGDIYKANLKYRFEHWNGHKWKKPPFTVSCDGPDCYYSRWSGLKTISPSIGLVSEEFGFNIHKYSGARRVEIVGTLGIYYKK